NTKAASKDPTISTDKKELTLQYTFTATGEAQKPVITLTADPANPVIKSGLDSVGVKFTYKITGDFDSASLNFGDNSEVSITQSGGTESHTYTSASTFTVTMRAGNENGTTTKTLSLPITKEQFKASISANPQSGEAPLKVLFTDTSTGTSGKVVQRSWDFGDGTTAASQNSVTHTFEKEGTYFVKLFISDGLNQDTATKTITVTKNGEKEPAKIDVDYEPFIIIGDVGVPSPFDLIAEFVRLIQAMLNFDNYIFSGENAES
ncbi:MAG: PKD domain-containing protein, partial [Methanocorpusculum sp.]|nr:PKD domain-containing protein [Methanocorpusculum sp.]